MIRDILTSAGRDGASLAMPRKRRASVPAFKSWEHHFVLPGDSRCCTLHLLWMPARRWERSPWRGKPGYGTVRVGPFVIAYGIEV